MPKEEKGYWFSTENGTLEHLKRHIANNKDYSYFIKLR